MLVVVSRLLTKYGDISATYSLRLESTVYLSKEGGLHSLYTKKNALAIPRTGAAHGSQCNDVVEMQIGTVLR